MRCEWVYKKSCGCDIEPIFFFEKVVVCWCMLVHAGVCSSYVRVCSGYVRGMFGICSGYIRDTTCSLLKSNSNHTKTDYKKNNNIFSFY